MAHLLRDVTMPFNLPPVTKALMIANVVVFLLQWLLGDTLAIFELWPIGGGDDAHSLGFMPWQLLTYGFMHADGLHLMFNMLALLMFGAPLEYTWRERRFLTFFLVCIVGAALCQLAVGAWTMSQGGQAYSTVGASGGVFGLLLAYGMLFPTQRVVVFPLPIPVKARTLVIVYGVAELLMGITNTMPGVAHFAHIGGMLFGWLLIRYWQGKPPFGRRPPRRKLKVVR